MKTETSMKTAKAAFQSNLKIASSASSKLAQTVKDLVGDKPSKSDLADWRETFMEWGLETGLAKTTVANIVSRAFIDAGLRARKEKKVKASKEAVSLLAYAKKQFGDKAGKHLLAAYRLSKKASKK